MLNPLKTLSLEFQNEKHDPVLAVRRTKELNWTMTKLQLLLNSSLSGDNGDHLIHFTKLLREID